MRWSFILFLPAVVTLGWALVTLTLKRGLTRAQVVLSLTMLLEAFAMVVLSVFFRGRAGSLFIYDFLFESVAMVCVPMYYVGICALTEPRGATLRQRRTFLIPLLFIAGLTAGAFWLGPRRYESMCHLIREDAAGWLAGDRTWNYMLFWDHWLFPILMLVTCLVLMLMAMHKNNVYTQRFNRYYAQGINVPQIDSRRLMVYTWITILLGVAAVGLIDFRPPFFKYWLIGVAVMMTVMQFLLGAYICRLDYDARYLARLVKQNNAIFTP